MSFTGAGGRHKGRRPLNVGALGRPVGRDEVEGVLAAPSSAGCAVGPTACGSFGAAAQMVPPEGGRAAGGPAPPRVQGAGARPGSEPALLLREVGGPFETARLVPGFLEADGGSAHGRSVRQHGHERVARRSGAPTGRRTRPHPSGRSPRSPSRRAASGAAHRRPLSPRTLTWSLGQSVAVALPAALRRSESGGFVTGTEVDRCLSEHRRDRVLDRFLGADLDGGSRPRKRRPGDDCDLLAERGVGEAAPKRPTSTVIDERFDRVAAAGGGPGLAPRAGRSHRSRT